MDLIEKYYNCSDEDKKRYYLGELYKQYTPLFMKFSHKYQYLYDYEDSMQECFIALLKALNYNKEQQSENFTTFLINNIQWHLIGLKDRCNLDRLFSAYSEITSLNAIVNNEEANTELIDLIPSELDQEETIIENFYNDYITKEIKELISELDEEEKSIISLKYFENKSYREIEEIKNISYKDALSIKTKAMTKLKKFVKKRKEFYQECLDKYVNINFYKSSIENFKRTGESTVEKNVFKIMDIEEYKRINGY